MLLSLLWLPGPEAKLGIPQSTSEGFPDITELALTFYSDLFLVLTSLYFTVLVISYRSPHLFWNKIGYKQIRLYVGLSKFCSHILKVCP